ncbi:LytR/AlgR family response regulator transcription factor [Aestuariibaculum sediminum]|uniref:Response regulator transcription factor n=1 Tax=Aestuariibaculum sediminum TaxID=2770637 RepID=A0A8J6Q9R9_9FLAO|nr:LytTR family DNA-binding domain-containing protein [Aestuariibaculum sediminum]MBD0832737.1 response regulator transcription factor [Aestuariibaculum sediminum]
MNAIIIDDELTFVAILKKLCDEIPDLNIVATFENATEAIKYLNKQEVDLIFLDMHLPDFTGFEFIQTLKNQPKIIVISSDSKLAITAFEYECIVDYIEKPVKLSRLKKSIEKLEKSFNDEDFEADAGDFVDDVEDVENTLFININKKLIKIDIQNINIVVAKGDYIYIKTEDKNHIVHASMKKILDKLPNSTFMKVHRSYIINLKKIDEIEENVIYIGKNVIPLSKLVKPQLISRLNIL